MAVTRRTHSAVSRAALASKRIHDQVDAEFGDILARESLAIGGGIPLRCVVLAAVEKPDPSIHQHRVQVGMQQVVAPPIVLLHGVGWSFQESEEAVVDVMTLRQPG